MRIAAIPGDGIGKEVLPEGIRVLQAAAERWGFDLSFEQMEWASCEYYSHHGKMMPDDWHEQLSRFDAIYFGAVGWPDTVPDHISLWGSLLKFRREFDQYVNLRPVRLFPGVPCPLAGKQPGDIDFYVVRENTEGEYSSLGGRVNEGTEHEVVIQESVFTRRGVDRILRYAFEVRGRDKVLRAFYNVCPHRGHQLLSGEGKAKNVITCPYHAWAFKLDGNLAHARNCENVANFDSDKAQLVPVRLEEYAGFVFINMDPNATSVEDQLPGLGAKVLEACPEVHDLKLAARFTTRTTANWKNIVDNYLECYHCGPAHPGFSDSVQVDRYWHTMHGNWTLQYGFAKPSEQSFKFEECTDAAFHGFWLWPCTMLNVTPIKGMMTVIYEFPVDSETTLQNYDIYFTNEELTDEQKSLIEWYRDVFRPEDLRLVESVQKGLKSRGYRGQGRIMADSSGSGISEHGIAHFHNLLAQVFKD
ncbi:TPA: isocitrate/isopropylmalate family dehydrogenase [Escherichia coli]